MGWDSKKGRTFIQREKEEAHDYRYFPEPDLPPLQISREFVRSIKKEIPELPQNKRERFLKEYKISLQEVEIFLHNKKLSDYFEKVISELMDWLNSTMREVSEKDKEKTIKIAVNYIVTDLQGLIVKEGTSWDKLLITPENFAEFITLIYKGHISSKIAKTVLKEMFDTGADPSQIIEKKKISLVTNEEKIKKILERVVLENKKAVEDYNKGKQGALQFLIGKAMALSRGGIDPERAREVLEDILKKA